MTEPLTQQHIPQRHPTAINLHTKSRRLTIAFDDGTAFELPCEYLRVFSRAAEVRTMTQPVTGKEDVNILAIEPQGQYAVRILFDDGHDTGIYSWDTLYRLGQEQEQNWTDYLARLEQIGYQRHAPEAGAKRIRLLYFAWLARKLRKESEELMIPTEVRDVEALLRWLGSRKRGAAVLFEHGRVQVTINRQFSELFTQLQDGDEIGIVPTSPTPPATPDLI
jgi:DUF971 family protein/molybdopterin converting factor small subunit